MATTILYTAVAPAITAFPQHIAEMRSFLQDHGLPVSTSQALSEIAARLGGDPEFHDDVASMLQVIRLGEGDVSTLELLAILLVAAAGEAAATDPSAQAANDGAARRLFHYVKTATRFQAVEALHEPTAGPENEDFEDLAPWDPSQTEAADFSLHETSLAENTGEARRDERSNAGVGLSRALALSAEDEQPFDMHAAVKPATVHVKDEPSRTLLPLAERNTAEESFPLMASQGSTAESSFMSRWAFGAGGIVLGLLLGFFAEREKPLHTPETPATVTMPSEAGSDPAPELPTARRHASVRAARAASQPSKALGAAAERDLVAEATTEPEKTSSPEKESGAGISAAALAPSPGLPGRSSRSAATPRAGLAKKLPLGPASDEQAATASSAGVGSGRVTVGTAGVMASNVLSSPTPSYPVQASAAAVQGEVVVEAIVGRDGDVIDTRVVSGPLLLREAALQAVQQWHYRPYQVDGKPVEIATTARFDFRLGR